MSKPISIYFVNAQDIDIDQETILSDIREAAWVEESADSAGEALRVLVDYINTTETTQDFVYIVSNGLWEEVVYSPNNHLNGKTA